ncbi:transporter substrate-binding domain-containing protein [Arenimonas sp.]|uniref:transporter substrate-binding domain-containing protein n=1 Tax=Arenimonas sp. TaxID=1872635 RepID=UPI0035AFCC1E
MPLRLWFAVLLLALACLPAQAAAPQSLRVGGDPNYRPFHYLAEDGTPQGLDVAVMQAIARERGLSPRFEFGEWGRMLDRLEHGEVDAVPMFISEDRAQRFRFSRPFLRRHHVLYGRRGQQVGTPDQLAGRRVAVQFGGMAWEWLISREANAVLRPMNDEAAALAAVAAGNADYALLPSDIAERAIARGGLDEVQPVGPPWLERNYAFGVNPARPELVAELDAGLAALEASGELARLQQRWLQPAAAREKSEPLPVWLPMVPVALVLLGALGFVLRRGGAGRD